MTAEKAKSTVFIDNDRVRVLEWRFAPGAEVGHHVHGLDYVVVPIMDGNLRAVTSEGESVNQLKVGQPYFRNAGVEHNVINANAEEFAFIEVELKP